MVTTDSVTLTEVHRGRLDFGQAAKSGRLTISGPRDLARAFPPRDADPQGPQGAHPGTMVGPKLPPAGPGSPLRSALLSLSVSEEQRSRRTNSHRYVASDK